MWSGNVERWGGVERGGIDGRQERESPERQVSVAGHRGGMVESQDEGPTWEELDPCRGR